MSKVNLRSQRSGLSPWHMLLLRKAGRGTCWQEAGNFILGRPSLGSATCTLNSHLDCGQSLLFPPCCQSPSPINPFSPHSGCQRTLQMCSYRVHLFAYLFMVGLFHNYVNCMREKTYVFCSQLCTLDQGPAHQRYSWDVCCPAEWMNVDLILSVSAESLQMVSRFLWDEVTSAERCL